MNTGVSKLDRNVSFIALDGKNAFIIELPDNFPQYHVLRIEIYPQVKQVHIYSKSYKEYGIYIVVHNRTTDLDLHLENVKMIAPNMEGSYNDFKALSVVSMSTTNNSALNLYAYGHVEMYGSSGYDQLYNKPAKDGNYAINCSVLNFKRAERLYLYGGDGGICWSENTKGIYSVCENV